jgi:hypothetical protein
VDVGLAGDDDDGATNGSPVTPSAPTQKLVVPQAQGGTATTISSPKNSEPLLDSNRTSPRTQKNNFQGGENRLQLLAEKKRIEEKLGKLSYPEEDADRLRLKQINAQLGDLGPIPTPAPKPQPQVDSRPTAGELVARDKQAALIKRAHELGFADGLNGKYGNAGAMADRAEVKGDPTILPMLQGPYAKGFGEAVPQRQNELVEAHKTYKATGRIPQTKQPYAWIEIKEGRMMSRAERMDAMLKAQGRPYPTMDMVGDLKVNQQYLTFKEFEEEVKNRAKVEHQQCEDEYIRPGKIRKCIGAVDDKYGGKGFQEYDRRESQRKLQQINAVAERIEDTKNAGPVKLFSKGVCRGAGYLIDGDEGAETGDEICGMVGGAGDFLANRKVAKVAKQRTANYGNSNAVRTPSKPPAGGSGGGAGGVGGSPTGKPAKDGGGRGGKPGGTAGKKDKNKDGSPKSVKNIVKTDTPTGKSGESGKQTGPSGGKAGGDGRGGQAGDTQTGDGTKNLPAGSIGARPGGAKGPSDLRPREEIAKEIREEQEVIKDLARQGDQVLNDAGHPVVPKPGPAKRRSGAVRRRATRGRSYPEVIEDQLQEVANNPNSPHRQRAQQILDQLRARRERIRHLNGLLDPIQRDRIK